MHTHYDNLKVSRDAPFEVIRAAYKSLSQKYHPDRHADGEEANRIMRLINAAYEVLSDPVRRDEHDRWIVTQERLEASQRGRRPAAATTPRPGAGVPPRPTAGAARPRPQPEAQPQTARQERARKAEAEKADKARKEREQAQAREQARERERQRERQREQESREQEAKREADARRRRAERAEQDERERQRAERNTKESDQRRGPQAGGRTMREDGFQPARLSGRSWSMLVYALAATAIVVLLSDWVPGASLDAPTANAATDASSTAAATPAGTFPSPSPSPAAIASSIISTREETRYLRPALTPKGEPWPERSGYVPGYPVLNTDGLSMVTIDNTRSKFDVFLKLVSTDSTRPLPVRTSYVRSGTSFTMENIAPGSYDVRYRSLDTGEIFRSERFELKEIQEATGTSFAKNILSLYSVEGKARNVSIPEREFP